MNFFYTMMIWKKRFLGYLSWTSEETPNTAQVTGRPSNYYFKLYFAVVVIHIICICNILSLLMFIYVPEKTS